MTYYEVRKNKKNTLNQIEFEFDLETNLIKLCEELINKTLKDNNYEMTNNIANDFISCINSYLGLLKHYKSYKMRKKLLENNVDKHFWRYFYIGGDYLVVNRKKNI